MLRHLQSISVAFCCITGKVGCYFLAFYHPSTVLSHPLCWESSQDTWNCIGEKTSRKSSTFTPSQCDHVAWRENRELVQSWLVCWYMFGNYHSGNNFKLPHVLSSSVYCFWFVLFSPSVLAGKKWAKKWKYWKMVIDTQWCGKRKERE